MKASIQMLPEHRILKVHIFDLLPIWCLV